ncbi:hypothetical protein [Hyperthermus butylicus]|uniref:hypothetical protein n=1 Tax=Hyperthermus butylicus TaxID=54248 RepID=UPI00064F9945|nr:hypothetical protein [Hyperthermus butylicus]
MGSLKRKGLPVISRILVLLSCYDYRLEAEKFGVVKQTIHPMVASARKKYKPVYHIKDLRPLGFATILATMRDRELWRKLANTNSVEYIENHVVLGRYVSSIVLTVDGHIIVTYNVPKILLDDAVSVVEKWYTDRQGEVVVGETMPVRNCAGVVGQLALPSLEQHYHVARMFEEYRSRMPFMDYILLSILDHDPLLPLSDVRNLVHAIEARIEKEIGEGLLRYRYVLRHYRSLSEKGVLGRARIPKIIEEPKTAISIIAEEKCAPKLYAYAAAYLASSRMFISKSTLVVGLYVPQTVVNRLAEEAYDCIIEAYVPVKGFLAPFPFEMYDPIRDEWSLEPVSQDIVNLLRKFRLLA